MKRVVITFVLVLTVFALFAQKEMIDVNSGNRKYKDKKYVDAEIDYRKALEKNPKSFSANFNLGNALFRQEKYEDAAKQYANALDFAGDDKIRKAHVYHNIGNSLLMNEKYQESIEAYKLALRNNPNDDETRYNLAFAKKKLQQQQQQQQNQDQQQQNQDQQQQNQDQQQQNQNQDQQKQDKDQQQQQQPQPKENGMSKEEAEQILQALQQDEKDTQERKKVRIGERRRVSKDW